MALYRFFCIVYALLWEKQSLPNMGLIYKPNKFVYGTLIKGDHMIISAYLQSTLSISFWEEEFQRINMH